MHAADEIVNPSRPVRAMTERGDGAVLMTTGYSAVQPMPHLSGLGPVMSAARNYVYSLNGELADTGVYAGTLSIAAMIARSEAAEANASAELETVELPGGFELTVVDPDDLAEHYWDMYTRRDRVEQIHPASLAPHAGAAA
jgi:hypothetical protein